MTDEATLRGGNSSAGGLDHYQHADWLGNARLGSQPYAAPPWSETAYAPFGEPYAQSGATDLSFTGQNSDTVSSDYDFLFREYSIQGRWPSPDPAGLAAVDPSNPQSWNRYAYVLNNPLNLVDPFGLCGGGPLNPDDPCVPFSYGAGGCIVSVTYHKDKNGFDIPDQSITCFPDPCNEFM